ncbi:arginine repressor [Lactococcus termiticola]|uniref:Arginine repressor n=1 Tax=Lactococcus termiticola TaxID=2169526 RepID=A0A2R5HL56_9LACT|nr:arginine repressor [Lactococcus termiticola]GBG97541.1 arginine repressor [Lactococcus termiticola]
MQRTERLEIIKEVILEEKISTQEMLQKALSERGIEVTQATLSRDIRKLHIIKKREGNESYYGILDPEREKLQSQLHLYFYNFVISARSALNQVVITTKLGEADVLANAFDEGKNDRPEILGTIAGADTLLVICESEKAAKVLVAEINYVLN